MKRFFTVIFLISLSFAQNDRSTIFNTGTPPDLGIGWNITCNQFEDNNIGNVEVAVDPSLIVKFVVETTNEEAPTSI